MLNMALLRNYSENLLLALVLDLDALLAERVRVRVACSPERVAHGREQLAARVDLRAARAVALVVVVGELTGERHGEEGRGREESDRDARHHFRRHFELREDALLGKW